MSITVLISTTDTYEHELKQFFDIVYIAYYMFISMNDIQKDDEEVVLCHDFIPWKRIYYII